MNNDVVKGNILIVDDEKNLRDTLSAALMMEGYSVCVLENGYKAIQKVKEESFDAALIDIKMPGINGVDTFREIKKISPETVVIMMTAYAVESLIQQALNEGAYICVNKPFDVEEIIAEMKKIQQKTIVLVVDDDVNINELLTLRLSEKGCKVVSVLSGIEAEKMITRRPFDVVLLDIVMPEMDGIETLKKIKGAMKEKCPKIFLMSSYDAKSKIDEGLALGAKKFFKKPLNIEKLDNDIKQVLRECKDAPVRILVADDDTSISSTLSAILKEKGYDVEVASTGEDTIKKLQIGDWKLVILDVKLPDINGLELSEKIKKIKPDTKIIMITGFSNEKDIIEAVKKEGFTCMYKPFNPEDLVCAIKKIVEKKGGGEENGKKNINC
ncbi:MAG: response regulator [Elusimicrobiota bacterium]